MQTLTDLEIQQVSGGFDALDAGAGLLLGAVGVAAVSPVGAVAMAIAGGGCILYAYMAY